MAGPALLTENDPEDGQDLGQGGTVAPRDPLADELRSGDQTQRDQRQRPGPVSQEQEPEIEVVFDDGQEGGEARLTEGEGAERPLLDQRQGRQDGARQQGQQYTKEQVQAMTSEQRKQAWRALHPSEWKQNRHLDRARKKDLQHNGRVENEQLRGELATTRQQLQELAGTVAQFVPKLNDFQRNQAQNQLSNLDGQYAEADRAYQAAKAKIAQAFTDQDGNAASAALEESNNAFVRRAQIDNQRKQIRTALTSAAAAGDPGSDQRQQQPQRQPAPQPQERQAPRLNRSGQQLVRDFMERHDWYDKDSGPTDDDSRLVDYLDEQLMAQGYDPNSEEYFEELEDRMRARMPERFEQRPNGRQQQNGRANGNGTAPRQQQPTMRRGPATGAGGGDRPSGGKIRVVLNDQRRQAMIETGALAKDGRTINDPVKYKRLVKQYASFDRENGLNQ